MSRLLTTVWLAALLLASGLARAHELSIAELELRETARGVPSRKT